MSKTDMDNATDAGAIIKALGLKAHSEGGWYRETWRAGASQCVRPSGRAIYYLHAAGERSHWHRIDATEIWHFYAGAALELRLAAMEAGPAHVTTLGPNIGAGERPQCVLAPGFDIPG